MNAEQNQGVSERLKEVCNRSFRSLTGLSIMVPALSVKYLFDFTRRTSQRSKANISEWTCHKIETQKEDGCSSTITLEDLLLEAQSLMIHGIFCKLGSFVTYHSIGWSCFHQSSIKDPSKIGASYFRHFREIVYERNIEEANFILEVLEIP